MTALVLDPAWLAEALRAGRGFAHKRDIAEVMDHLAQRQGAQPVRAAQSGNGDDCAVLPTPQGEGHLLLAIEGMTPDFVAANPWFAGYSAVVVNLSDVYAMGGRPLALVDALWSLPEGPVEALLDGMSCAARRYRVPLVGGHSNLRSDRSLLAVAVLGHARRLISSFEARPGDRLLMAVDLRGAYEEPFPFWNASTRAPEERLREDLEVLPLLAEAGLCRAGKDISMAGALGSALMLLECSGVGARIDLDALPRPPGIATPAEFLRWLQAFPSYGFVLSVAPDQVAEVLARFHARGLACAAIGQVDADPQVHIRSGGREALLWNLAAEPFITTREQPHASTGD
ncbi:MAG: hypothetical protein RLZZ592_2101 [Pseudomonadota bacterium]|jgi:AIR synthase-related protein